MFFNPIIIYFFSYIVFNSEQLFDFLEEIEKKTIPAIDVSQNAGKYIVEPVPKYVRGLFKNWAKQNVRTSKKLKNSEIVKYAWK
ncbi:MAG: hypothetical protein Q8Q42_00760 [Nanoarchaeota archaeon]|nr:hypothetical protein [Nanoarchaeota archaeon]